MLLLAKQYLFNPNKFPGWEARFPGWGRGCGVWGDKPAGICCPPPQLSMGKINWYTGTILLLRFDHEIFATVILSLPLIQEGKFSVTCERMCTEYWLTD